MTQVVKLEKKRKENAYVCVIDEKHGRETLK